MEESSPICTRLDEVYWFYLFEARRVCTSFGEEAVVLKTDLYNEAGAHPTYGGIVGNLPLVKKIFAIEIDPTIIANGASSLLQHTGFPLPTIGLYHGDIRSLPDEWTERFHVVLDLSTFDHIHPDTGLATLEGYARVLKSKGQIMLVVWCKESPDLGPVEWKSENQYYYTVEMIKQMVETLKLEISKQLLVFTRMGGEAKLWYFLLQGPVKEKEDKADEGISNQPSSPS